MKRPLHFTALYYLFIELSGSQNAILCKKCRNWGGLQAYFKNDGKNADWDLLAFYLIH